mgnify:CR=1 FL=1|jgi:hypothetical protein
MIVLQRISDGASIQTWSTLPRVFVCALGEVNGASVGWQSGDFRLVDVPDPQPEPPTVAELKAYAAEKRWQVEVGGVLVEVAPGVSVPVPTDDRAKLLILGAAQTLTPDATAPFVAGGVVYGTLSGAQFVALHAAVVAHVQATFPVLAELITQIDAGTVTSTTQIDAAAWPGGAP